MEVWTVAVVRDGLEIWRRSCMASSARGDGLPAVRDVEIWPDDTEDLDGIIQLLRHDLPQQSEPTERPASSMVRMWSWRSWRS